MILLLAGTREGRKIFSLLSKNGYPVIATVTTSYGAQILKEQEQNKVEVLLKALNCQEFISLIKEKGITVVIDASHPFAAQATKNALHACKVTGAKYIRFERLSLDLPDYPLIFPYQDFNQAAQKAASFGEVIFLTTGSKTLHVFVEEARKYGKRVVARVLPDPGILSRCFALGLKPADIIAMQGPFSYELNRALLSNYRASVLVTKESGPAGGTDTKIKASMDLGIPVVLIKRPLKEYLQVVHTFDELLAILNSKLFS